VSNDDRHIAARGRWGTIEWAIDSQGAVPGREVYLKLPHNSQKKVLTLFQRLADFGVIPNVTKFKQLGPKAGPKGRGLWEFKSFQIRFIGNYRKGQRFVIAHGLDNKKARDLRQADIDRAVRILDEYDVREEGTL